MTDFPSALSDLRLSFATIFIPSSETIIRVSSISLCEPMRLSLGVSVGASVRFCCDLQGRKVNFTNSKTLVGWLLDVATDHPARYL